MKTSTIFTGTLLYILVNIWAPTCCASINKSKISDLFTQAKEMFRQADNTGATDPEAAKALYKKSAVRFERIIKNGGVRNGKLYYNLANVYFRMHDLGRAILNYRRAMQYIPNDSNLNRNLEYARAVRIDRIEERMNAKVFKTLFFWHYDLPVKARLVFFTAAFILIWIFASIRLFLRKEVLRWCFGLSIAISLCLSVSLATDAISLHQVRPGVIINSEVVARKGNSKTYEPSFKEPLHSGTEFRLLEDRGKWFHVELPDSRSCWVPAASVELVR